MTGFAPPRRPRALTALDALGRLLPRRPLDAGALMARAERAAGLGFGADAEAIIEPLRLLCADLGEADLHPIGRAGAVACLHALLVGRLEIARWVAAYPAVHAVPIERPLVIVGLARTGTTLLHRLLAQDPAARWLSLGETVWPRPPVAAPADDRRHRRRLRAVAAGLRLWSWMAPELVALHELDVAAPDEENPLMQRAFASPLFLDWAPLPRYTAWLRGLPPERWAGVYRYVRLQLQLASFRAPGRWLLKSPSHAWSLDGLLAACPDALLVETRRELGEALSSACSLAAVYRSLYARVDRTSGPAIGREVMAWAEEALVRTARVRARLPAAQRAAVDYRGLVRDPIAVVRALYDHAGWPLTSAAEQRMRAYLAAHPQHRHGVHRPRLADFGLGPADVALLEQRARTI